MHNVLFYLIFVSRNLIDKMDLITTTFATLTLYLILAPDRIFTAADETTKSEEPTKCGKNEEYTTCNLCPKNCENPFQEICSPGPCIKTCKCKSGYYKDSGGVCVSIIACIVDNIRNRILQVTERSDPSSTNTS
ncbi:uncharacterized protein LOC100644783 isoform X1 [Bombus terrestris]|uniref:Uncharacterized protein LOC100644783 isoform X1 n=1 Tax=Bombus terrestris TaxID=30195 RepID=A0A9B0F6T0_BOMTE|nr:uncharacterized protein LOC100644783 isoform X1 [Bombus terrestris]